MKLVSLHIDNFGKFNNLDMSFNNGLNQLIEENGWGKSTLTAFIKVMFYGFDNSSKRDSYENERKRYKPWNGGIYGGNITFCFDDKRYTIYRTFEAKDKDDTFRLVDQRTMLVSLDYSSNIGYEIFKIDSSTFKKTLCIYENNCITESTGDIEALLGDEQSDTEDINNFDKVIKSMDDKLNALSPDRKTGELYKQKDKLNEIQAQLKEMPVLEDSIDTAIRHIKDTEKLIEKLSLQKQHIKKELDKASYYNEMQSILKQYNIYSRQLEEKRQAYEEKLEEYGRLPDINDVCMKIQYADRILDKYSQLKELEPNKTQYDRLHELKASVSCYSHHELKEQIDNINHLNTLKSEIQSELSVADKYRNILLIAAITAGLLSIIVGAITGTGVLLIPIGIILIIAGIVYNKNEKTGSIGTIGIAASGKAGHVIGVELNKDAVKDAEENAKINNIKNIRFVNADAGEFLVEYAAKKKAAVVIMDPPRSGSSEEFLNAILKIKPDRVVYVSCNPDTQRRDVEVLLKGGYKVKGCKPFDMFPFTDNVETVILLSRKAPDAEIRVRLDMSELDITSAESKATYKEIQEYVKNKYSLHVTNLYIAQVKREFGIIERENYNTGEGKAKVPQVTAEKRESIIDALRYFQMIE